MFLLLCCFVALGLPGVRADFWDDFSNNLATDLAPFVSLFGEQTTKQYLSESITKLDYFIFSMAPIGILTAIVSAIRVCGSSSLRAFIGRAQEGGGNAEAELCSSTSRDVCELYNNGGIARVFGRPKILEIVHDPNASDSEFKDSKGGAGIYTFQEYVTDTPNGKREWTLRYGADIESPPEEYAPNLSHNVGIKRPDDWVFVAVAFLGFVLQGGVLVFAACVTYFLRWEKNGAQPPTYACPLSITGTIFMCGGVYLCAYLVGQSTKEHIYRRVKPNALRSYLYWVQPRQVLGDQTFDPFCYIDSGNHESLRQYTASWKEPDKSSEFIVWLAVGVTIVGFVLQFVGLRGVHYSISVAQLGSALVMSAVRSALRTQRLETKDNHLSHCRDLVNRHELDWLALRMGEETINADLPPCPPRFSSDTRNYYWRFCGMAKQNIRVRKEPLPITTSANAGGKILAYRRRLAYLTDSGTASQLDSTLPSRRFETDIVEVRAIARQLVLAIESAANMLFSTSPRLKDEWKQSPRLFWAITCSVSCTGRIADQEPRKLSRSFARISETQFADKKSKEQVLYLESSRDSIDPGSEGKYWKFEDKHQVEAVLGLWVWSLKSDPAANAVDPREKWPKTASEPAAKAVDLGDRPKNAYAPILLRRIVCWDKSPEDMGFKLWFPSRFLSPRESKIFGSEQDTTSYTRWKVSGEEYRKFDWNEYRAWDTAHSAASVEGVMVRLFGWYGAELESLDSSGTGSCKVWTLPTKCTLLSLCAQEVFAVFVKCVLEVVQDIGEVGVQEEPNDIRFSNQLVSEVVEAFVDAQLGSREEALLCVLPQVLFEEARAGRTPLWHAAGNGQERMVNDLLHRAGRDIHLPDNKGRTPLCQAASNGHEAVVKCLLKCGVDTNGDSQRKTPLSEAAANGHLAVVQVLLEEGTTNPDLKDDKGRTALWRAAASGHEAVVRLLLEEGASPDISDNSNVTPQSKASEEGHEGIVRILREHNEGLGSESLILGGRAFEKDQVKIELANLYTEMYNESLPHFFAVSEIRRQETKRVRIAILTTGVDLHSPYLRGEQTQEPDRIEWKSWVEDGDIADFSGHGTHMTTLTLRYAPFAKIYVAKFTKSERIESSDVDKIEAAIAWAVETCKADIIVMPMGFSSTHKVIREALKLAHKRSKVVFAAAGGYGFNQRRCYPASSPHVIGIHAVDGRGKDCGISAAPVKGDYNFSALGVCANSFWGGVEKKFISGSAYATAIAAGIAASLLHFVRLNLELEHAEDWEWLRLISTEIDGYRCIMPSLFGHDSTTEDICKTIMMVVRKNRMSRGSRNVHY